MTAITQSDLDACCGGTKPADVTAACSGQTTIIGVSMDSTTFTTACTSYQSGLDVIACSTAFSAITLPASSSMLDPSAYTSTVCSSIQAASNACSSLTDSSVSSIKSTLALYAPMCTTSSCDYLWSTGYTCIQSLGSDMTAITQSDLDACCGGTKPEDVTAACNGQTTILGTTTDIPYFASACASYADALAPLPCTSAYSAIDFPSDVSDPASWTSTLCAALQTAEEACNGLTDSFAVSSRQAIANFQPMCSSTSCDYQYSASIKCLQALGPTSTQSELDVCCSSAVLTGIANACSGQTTLYGSDPTSGQDDEGLTDANWHTYVGLKCSEFQTILVGGTAGGLRFAGPMAVAVAAGAAAFNFI